VKEGHTPKDAASAKDNDNDKVKDANLNFMGPVLLWGSAKLRVTMSLDEPRRPDVFNILFKFDDSAAKFDERVKISVNPSFCHIFVTIFP
jgi:hypothetical protein